jgi:hypothetical protein
MRIFGSIVLSQPLLMRAGQSQTPERAGIRAQLVGDERFRCEALLLEQLAHEQQRCPTIAPPLDQNVQDLTLVVDGTPRNAGFPWETVAASPRTRYRREYGRSNLPDHHNDGVSDCLAVSDGGSGGSCCFNALLLQSINSEIIMAGRRALSLATPPMYLLGSG